MTFRTLSTPLPVWAPPDPDPVPDPAPAAAPPPAPAPAPAPAPRNALDDTGDEPPISAPANWPENWRDQIAGDKGNKKLLERFASPSDLFKSYEEAQAKIRKGLQKPDRPEGDDPEKLKAWRKEMDIPDDPSGYVIPDILKNSMTDADKPAITAFTEEMHKRNWSQRQVADGLEWYADWSAGLEAEREAGDKKAKGDVEESLRGEWGKEYKANKTAIASFAKELMGDIPWASARLPVDPALGELSGQMLGNLPEFMKGLLNAAVKVNGDVTFVDSDVANRTLDRMKELKAKLGGDITPEERNELIALEDKQAKRPK